MSNEEFGQFSCLTVSLAARLAAGSSSLIAAAAQALTNFLLWSIIAFTNKLDTDKVPVADKSSFAADKSSFSTVPPNSAKFQMGSKWPMLTYKDMKKGIEAIENLRGCESYIVTKG
ncbi:hypothetical protein LguiA_007518 [Lonicera macranthoides]